LLDTEGKIHSEYTSSIDNIKQEILDYIPNIIEDVTEELNSLRDEQFSKLTELQKKENDRYSTVCTEIQKQKDVSVSETESVHKGLESGDPATVIQTAKNATNTLLRLVDPDPSQINLPIFQREKNEYKGIFKESGQVITDGTSVSGKQNTSNSSGDDKQEVFFFNSSCARRHINLLPFVE